MTTDTNERHQQLLWFPMRITYGRTERMQRIKEMLEQEHLKCFLPMRVEFKKTDDFDVRKLTVPAVNGLIFVQASQEQLTQLKMTRREFEPMHYYTNHLAESGDDKILTIPDGQMENFMRAYTLMDDHVSLLEYTDFIAKPGKRVRVKEGIYENLVGTVKRIILSSALRRVSVSSWSLKVSLPSPSVISRLLRSRSSLRRNISSIWRRIDN